MAGRDRGEIDRHETVQRSSACDGNSRPSVAPRTSELRVMRPLGAVEVRPKGRHRILRRLGIRCPAGPDDWRD
jgi:hypothetical protein